MCQERVLQWCLYGAGVLALVYILDLGHVLNKFRHVTVEKLSWPPVNPPQWG